MQFIVFEGDIAIKGDFDKEWLTEQYNEAIIPRLAFSYYDLSQVDEDYDKLKEILKSTTFRKGLYITRFVDDSPFFKAGIQEGDILTHLRGVSIDNTNMIDDLKRGLKIGDTIEAKVYRNNEPMFFDVVLTPMQNIPCPELGVIIDGHLKVERDYTLGNYDSTCYVYIKKGLSCNYFFIYSSSFIFIKGGMDTCCGWQGDSNDGSVEILDGISKIPYSFNFDLAIGIGKVKGAIIGYDNYNDGGYTKDEKGNSLKCDNIEMLMRPDVLNDGRYLPQKIGE